MKILGIQKLTLLDYPEHLGAVLFLGGCNFRCPFCQNSSLVLAPETLPEYGMDELRSFLNKRRGILEGICVTGGEPTLHRDLPDLIDELHEMGYLVKIDTNGTNPEMLERLLSQGKLDYVAMDIKAGRTNYARVAGIDPESGLLSNIRRSADLLLHCSIPYEFRTTVVKGLHTADDFTDIADWLEGCQHYFLQCFRDCEEILMHNHPFSAFSEEEMKAFLTILQHKIPGAALRGI